MRGAPPSASERCTHRRSARKSAAERYMQSAFRFTVSSRRLAMTERTARCGSRSQMPAGCAVRDSLISSWRLQRLRSSADGGVVFASSVRRRASRCVSAASVLTIWSENLRAMARLTAAVTLGLPSRSDPTQQPGWTNAGHTGGTVPLFAPSSQSSKRR